MALCCVDLVGPMGSLEGMSPVGLAAYLGCSVPTEYSREMSRSIQHHHSSIIPT